MPTRPCASFPQVLTPDLRQGKKVLVFCSSVDSCRAVQHHCNDEGIKAVCYHGDMPVTLRQEAMEQFSGMNGGKERGRRGAARQTRRSRGGKGAGGT